MASSLGHHDSDQRGLVHVGAQTSELWVFLVTPLLGLTVHIVYSAIFLGLPWLLAHVRLRQAVAV